MQRKRGSWYETLGNTLLVAGGPALVSLMGAQGHRWNQGWSGGESVMSCLACDDLEVVRQGRCPSCGARFTQMWQGQRSTLRLYLWANTAGLLVIIALTLFGGVMQPGTLAFIVFPLATMYLGYRALKTAQALYAAPGTYRGTITDISVARLTDILKGTDQRLKINDRRFKLDEEALKHLHKGQEVLVHHTQGTNVVMELHTITEDQQPQEQPALARRRASRPRTRRRRP